MARHAIVRNEAAMRGDDRAGDSHRASSSESNHSIERSYGGAGSLRSSSRRRLLAVASHDLFILFKSPTNPTNTMYGTDLGWKLTTAMVVGVIFIYAAVLLAFHWKVIFG